jgi:hypothetical protein
MTDDTYIDWRTGSTFSYRRSADTVQTCASYCAAPLARRDWVLADAIENVVTELLQRMEAADRELREFDAWVSECEKEVQA